MTKNNTNPPPTYPKPPAPPAPPLIRIVTENSNGICDKCGSSLKSKMFKPIGCIQPLCSNYYEKNYVHGTTIKVREYVPKIKHFVTFYDFDRTVSLKLKEIFSDMKINEYNMVDYSDGDYLYIIDLNTEYMECSNIEDDDELIHDPEIEFINLIRKYLPPNVIECNKFAIKINN